MASQDFLEDFLSKTEVGFCMIDKDNSVIECNNAFKDATNTKNPVNQNIFDLLESEDDCEAFFSQVSKSGSGTIEVNFKRAKKAFFAIANATRMTEVNDPELCISFLFTAVNERKILESKLEERIAAEVEKNRKKDEMMNQQAKLATMGEMIGNIAHQWRQPLNILALVFQDIYIKYQLGSLDPDQMEKNYEKVNNLIQYMSQTIDDFRTFFKAEEGDAPFVVGTALNMVFELVGTRFSSSNTLCTINIKEDASVLGTENGFKQVVINLLNNAQEAILATSGKAGKIIVDVKKDKNMIVISVSDNGGGVPKNIVNQIFEPYFTTKHQTQGTGLGLYMSKKIIEHHMAGKLEVSNGDEGATFKISLPIS